MSRLWRDTSPEAEEILLEALRQKTPAERFRLGLKASEALRQMCYASVRMDYPEASEQEAFRHFADRWLGPELSSRVYGPESRREQEPGWMFPFLTETLGVIRCLERLGIPYMLGGSMAMSLHGVARATRDADVVAELRAGDGSRIAAELGAQYHVDKDTAEEAIRRRSSFNIIHLGQAFKIDIFPLEPRAYDRTAMSRRVSVPIEGAELVLYVESREDVLLAKLRWYRLGGESSEQQWRDVLSIVKLQRERLDLPYLRQWANEERVVDLLERALAQV